MKLLLQRRWQRGVALTLVVSAVCVLLGLWQLDRRQTKLERIHAVTAHYDDAPIPLSALLPEPGSALPAGTEWSPVEVTGQYLTDETLLVRNRTSALRDVTYGYLVLVPFQVDASAGGGVLVVNRGWIPNGESGAAPASVPAPPSGTVTLTARLRPAEAADPRGRSAPEGQVQRVDLTGSVPAALAETGPEGATAAASLYTGAYGWLRSEDPAATSGGVEAPQEPELDEGPHLGYSLQWFVFAIGVWVFFVVHVRRAEADEAAEAAAAGGPRPTGAGDPGEGPGPATAAPAAAPRRRRPTDDELEDAALDAAEAHRVP